MAWQSSSWGWSDWSDWSQPDWRWTGGKGAASAAERPGCGKGARSGAPSGSGGCGKGPAMASGAGSRDATATPASSGLPPGWEQITDAGSGKPYYWHPSTGETRWQPPQGTAAASSSGQASRWKRKHGKEENRRKKGNATAVGRDRMTKIITKLAGKDVAIGNLQAGPFPKKTIPTFHHGRFAWGRVLSVGTVGLPAIVLGGTSGNSRGAGPTERAGKGRSTGDEGGRVGRVLCLLLD